MRLMLAEFQNVAKRLINKLSEIARMVRQAHHERITIVNFPFALSLSKGASKIKYLEFHYDTGKTWYGNKKTS